MNDFRELKEPRPLNAAELQAIDDLKSSFKQNMKINFQTDNYFLTKYLRYRDWNVQAAYESIQNYYKIKVKIDKCTIWSNVFIFKTVFLLLCIFSATILKCTLIEAYPSTLIC